MRPNRSNLLAASLLLAIVAPAGAADVVVTPAAGSGFVVKDSAGASDRLRVSEAGAVSVPAVPAATAQTNAVCMSGAGLLGPCSGGGAGTFAVPTTGAAASATPLLTLTNSGTPQIGPGPGASALRLETTNPANGSPTLDILSSGTGSAIFVSAVGNGITVFENGPSGYAGDFRTLSQTNTSAALNVSGAGTGAALSVVSAHTGGPSDIARFASSGTVARIDSTGKGFFNGGTQMGGADVAELIPHVGARPMPGDVVMIDPAHPLHYRIADSALSTNVAGVVTTKPGVLMNAGVTETNDEPALALVGRVPVKATTEGGAIRPGDLLVSSSTAGHAMKAPAKPEPGTIVGKALEPLDAGRGVVEMLVMLR